MMSKNDRFPYIWHASLDTNKFRVAGVRKTCTEIKRPEIGSSEVSYTLMRFEPSTRNCCGTATIYGTELRLSNCCVSYQTAVSHRRASPTSLGEGSGGAQPGYRSRPQALDRIPCQRPARLTVPIPSSYKTGQAPVLNRKDGSLDDHQAARAGSGEVDTITYRGENRLEGS
jgi:hypothetical protein